MRMVRPQLTSAATPIATGPRAGSEGDRARRRRTMSAAAAAARRFEEMRSETEEKLCRVSSNWMLGFELAATFAGAGLVLMAAFPHSPSRTKADTIMMWVVGILSFLFFGFLFCRDLYLRRKLKRILAEMQPTCSDLESGL
ncbi:hypothetical protein ACP70R_007263 [Stipagrostis hirtigluma subsp. patula]